MAYTDITFEIRQHVAYITINRPEVMNAFRGQTCDELIHALHKAGYDPEVGVIVLAGAGDRAFCTGATSPPTRANTTAGARSGCRSRSSTRRSATSRCR